ncbi:hypothetical protein E2C01_019339 [Portunus trituberculatus]|uniref:Uncharacterized protein n=1 Tax=Portunus trituberculatus TaxID=210409 RepID=A0A5B7DXZ7_PORTR|nr:hypothetical protein [Portunus trituberculatus]
MLSWIGTGMALLAFCLFLAASQCMQGEQQREQAKQMQYIMPGNVRSESFEELSSIATTTTRQRVRVELPLLSTITINTKLSD